MPNENEEPPVVIRRLDQIVELAAEGLTDKEIATRLGIKRSTVETYWRRVRERFGTPNRAATVLASLRATVEQQSQDLRAANDALVLAHAASREGMTTLLADVQKRLSASRRGLDRQDFFEQASGIARAVAYELESINPVLHRRLSASAAQFGIDVSALEHAAVTYYDLVFEEDLPLVYEKSLGATYAPNERYVFVYRLKMPQPRWVIDTHQAIYDESGNFTGVVGMAIDVNELVRAGIIRAEVTRIIIPTNM